MSESLRKTFKYKLKSTPQQERDLERVVMVCRQLSNVALEQRITAWQRCHVSITRYEQEAELKGIRAEFPEYAAVHSHILHDVLARLDKTSQACFRRVQRGEKAGFPRFKGRGRFHSFPFKADGNGASLDNGFRVLSQIGRIAVRWSRPLEGMPKTVTISRETDGWYVAISCTDVPVHPLPATGQETGIDLGWESFATRSPLDSPSSALATTARRTPIYAVVSGGLPVARRGATDDARRWSSWPKPISLSRASGATAIIGKRQSW